MFVATTLAIEHCTYADRMAIISFRLNGLLLDEAQHCRRALLPPLLLQVLLPRRPAPARCPSPLLATELQAQVLSQLLLLILQLREPRCPVFCLINLGWTRRRYCRKISRRLRLRRIWTTPTKVLAHFQNRARKQMVRRILMRKMFSLLLSLLQLLTLQYKADAAPLCVCLKGNSKKRLRCRSTLMGV